VAAVIAGDADDAPAIATKHNSNNRQAAKRR
jgi:hypothetical protein